MTFPVTKHGEVFLVFSEEPDDPVGEGLSAGTRWKVYKSRSEMARDESSEEFAVQSDDPSSLRSFTSAVDAALRKQPATIHIVHDGLDADDLVGWAREVPDLVSYVEDDGQVMLGTENVSGRLERPENGEAPEGNSGASL